MTDQTDREIVRDWKVKRYNKRPPYEEIVGEVRGDLDTAHAEAVRLYGVGQYEFNRVRSIRLVRKET